MKSPVARCPNRVDCGYADDLRARQGDLQKLLEVIKGSEEPEDVRRRKALHTLKNTPKRTFDHVMCRRLGDAYFALKSPDNSTILTSNFDDHQKLAGALGKSVTKYTPA